MKILFLYPEQFGYFSDLQAYVEILRSLGFNAAYGGFASRPESLTHLPHIHHMVGQYSRKRFLNYCSELIDTLQPDLVHVFHFRGAGWLPWRTRTKPVWVLDVRTLHVATRHHRPARFAYLRDRYTWLEALQYNHVLALNEKIRRRMTPSRQSIEVIPLGVDAAKLNFENRSKLSKEIRTSLGISEDKLIVIYAGAISPARRVDHMLAAVAHAARAEPSLHFLIVGGESRVATDDDPNIQALKAQATALGLAEQVTFTGRVPVEHIPAYYAAADVGISWLPPDTPFQWQAPTKLIEYMLAGLIAVTNVTPGAQTLYGDSQAAIITGDTVGELADGLVRAAHLCSPEQEARRKAMLETAAARVQKFDLRYLIPNRLVPLYRQWVEQ